MVLCPHPILEGRCPPKCPVEVALHVVEFMLTCAIPMIRDIKGRSHIKLARDCRCNGRYADEGDADGHADGHGY